jgi:predicted ribosome quality control (RQC) complex YloA/Tae2 family protein
MNFREFKTSTNKKVLLGKNAEQNEELVKTYLNTERIVLHTEKPGSPFAIILDNNPSEKEIKEAATFCALKSKDWRDNKKDVSIHIFSAKDIYKRRNMPLGTFGVKNFKNILIKKEEILKLEKKIKELEEGKGTDNLKNKKIILKDKIKNVLKKINLIKKD